MKTSTRIASVLCFAAVAAVLPAKVTPLKIEQTVEARWPNALTYSPLSTGEAQLIVNVDADGTLVDVMVASYTNQAFADEAIRAVRAWRFTPATENGEPVGVRTVLRFQFEATARVVTLLPIETMDHLLVAHGQYLTRRVVVPHELDRPVAIVEARSPANPLVKSGAAKNTVLVDFYVDEKGMPRMPVILSSTHAAFSQAAVGALNQWRFSPPTRAGRPVAVRVVQEFVFPDKV